MSKGDGGDSQGVAGGTPVPDANHEPGDRDAPLGKEEVPRFDGQVDVLVVQRRRRLVDPDTLFAKYAIDSLVDLGVLEDDSPKHVRNVNHRQEKAKKEETLLYITEVEEDADDGIYG